jgi:hypothetical protein
MSDSRSPAPINTRAVSGRRIVTHLRSLDDVIADAQRLARAEQTRSLRQLGNWSLGQACNHLSVWIEFSYDGVPQPHPPFLVRLLARPFKSAFLNGNLPAGIRMRGVPGGTHGCEPMSTEEGISRLITSAARLDREAPTLPNVVFGPLTHAQWRALHINHAKLHLSFFEV